MIIKADKETCFIFDLDDTLYSEFDFLKSAYKFIANRVADNASLSLFKKMLTIYRTGGNSFDYIIKNFPEKNYTKEYLLDLYRNHFPEISLRKGVLEMLYRIKKNNAIIGIITNGRSITQRNKIKSLGLESIIDITVISDEYGFEKPSEILYQVFVKMDSDLQFYYFGDNLKNDFITPKRMGWCCVGVSGHNNIHENNIFEIGRQYLPHIFIKKFSEIEII